MKWQEKMELFYTALPEETDEINTMELALSITKGAVCYCDSHSIIHEHSYIKIFAYKDIEEEDANKRYKLIEVEKVLNNFAIKRNKGILINGTWKLEIEDIKKVNIEVVRAYEMMLYQKENLGAILRDMAERELQYNKSLYDLPFGLTVKELLISKIDRLLGIDSLDIAVYLLEKYRLSYLDLQRIEQSVKNSENEAAKYTILDSINELKKRYV